MCLISIAVEAHPEYPLVVAANRDEFHDRETVAAGFWHDCAHVLGGRDLQAGGSWLGMSRTGRFAAVTNFRDPARVLSDAPSRGGLVSDYLCSDQCPEDFLRALEPRLRAYNGFNLVVGARARLWYASNRGGEGARLGPGVYGLSNHLLNTPWPKVQRTRTRLKALFESSQGPTVEDLSDILDDREVAPDNELPTTGIALEWERALSAPCIVGPDYGTRASTVILVNRNDEVIFVEHTRNRDGEVVETASFNFEIS